MARLNSLIQSARYASQGLFLVWREEQNMRIEMILGLTALAIGFFLDFTLIELSIVTLLVGSILAAECANSAMERLVDIVKPRVSEYARFIKDIIAAMMLILVITSLLIGLFLYVPRLIILLSIVI